MASINKVILIGNLGQDPEVRYTAGGQAVATLNIATNERWLDKKTNQWQDRTEWHRVIVWGKQAENCKEYLSKGRPVYIEGRLQTRKWEDKQGQTKYTTEIVAQTVQFLGSRESGSRGMTNSDYPAESQGSSDSPSSAPASSSGSSNEPPPFDSEDDIPF